MDPKLVKLIVKQGLKLASPLFGSFVADLGSEVAGLMIDSRTAKSGDDVLARLSRQIEKELDAILAAEREGMAVASIMATIEAMVGDEPSLRSAWQEAGYDAELASRLVMSSKAALLRGLSPEEVSLSRRLIETLFRAAGNERKILDATESHFRRTVLAKLDILAAQPIPPSIKDRLVMETVLSIPSRPFIADLSPPGALLRADIDRPVPFHGRERELAELQSWTMSERPLELRLLTGGGGMGKTRLLTELCRTMATKGWTSGFLEKTINADVRSILAGALCATDKAFVVIDYAENRRSHVVDLIATALESLGRTKLRIVLLARAADDWWEALRGERGAVGDVLAGPACGRSALRPLATTVEERQASYHLAVRHFAAVLSKPPREDTELDFTDRAFDRALLLHMAALAAVEGVAVKGDQGVLDHALDRERRFWRERAQALGLDPLYERAILQAVAAITLVGGAHDRAAAIRVLGDLALLRAERAVVLDTIAQLLHDTYSGEQWIDPILPDLLGEHVVQNALEEDSGSLLDIALGTARP